MRKQGVDGKQERVLQWTIDGQLRVGFFALKSIEPGEEITFDYKFERFGKTAQECLCGAAECRGVIGMEAKDSGRGETEEVRESARERRERSRRRREQAQDEKMEAELAALKAKGRLSSRADLLGLSRLMVRGEDLDNRVRMLSLLWECEESLLRRFLDFSGLPILRCWLVPDPMMESLHQLKLRKQVLQLLGKLPIQHRNMVYDSKIIESVRRAAEAVPVGSARVEPVIRRVVSQLVESVAAGTDDSPVSSSPSEDSVTPEGSNFGTPNAALETAAEEEALLADCQSLATKLLQSWSSLKEQFKIPKKTAEVKVSEEAVVDKSNKRKHTTSSDMPQLDRRSSLNSGSSSHYRRDSGKDRPYRHSRHSSPDRHHQPLHQLPQPTPLPQPHKERRRQRSRSPSRSSRKGREKEETSESRGSSKKRSRRSRFDVGPDGESMSEGMGPMSAKEVEARRKAFESRVEAEAAEAAASEFDVVRSEVVEASMDISDSPPHSTHHHQHQHQHQHIDANAHPFHYPQPHLQEPPAGVFPPEAGVSSSLQPPRPGTLAIDPESGDYWWRDPGSYNLVKPCSAEQTAAVQHGDWSLTPWFSWDPGTERIVEVGQGPPGQPLASAFFPPPLHSLPPQPLPIVAVSIPQPLPQPLPVPAPPQQSEAEIEALRQKVALLEEKLKEKESADRSPSLPLPTDWRKAADNEGAHYYYNINTRETQWEHPGELNHTPAIVTIGDDMTPPHIDVQQSAASSSSAVCNTQSTTMAAADTSSDVARKAKEQFKAKISQSVCKWLAPYRKPNAAVGRLTATEDFKHVARKMTHVIWEKELKRAQNRTENVKISGSVLAKAKTYVKNYMNRQGPVYSRKASDPS